MAELQRQSDVRVLDTSSESETSAAGEALARRLHPGDVILLYGELGAGKTAFVRGLARGLGANADEVSSPTFTLVQEYAATAATLYHVDLYRLSPPEIDDLGLDELVGGGGILAIEWADRWPHRPSGVTEVRLTAISDDSRRIRITR